jgi:hypothetical protein
MDIEKKEEWDAKYEPLKEASVCVVSRRRGGIEDGWQVLVRTSL